MRKVLGIASLAAAFTILSLTGAAAESKVVIAGSGGVTAAAHRESGYAPFTKETGITIVEDEWDFTLGTLRAQVESGSPKWDVVQVSADTLNAACAEGVLEPIDWDAIPEEADYYPQGISKCGVGSTWSASILAYDAKRTPNPPASWADFFDTKKWPGKRGMWFKPTETLEIALMADGVAPKEVYATLSTPEGLERAFKKLDTIKPEIIWWKSGAESVQRLAAGTVVFTTAWNGRPVLANRDNKELDLKISWSATPVRSLDAFAIPAGAKNLADAQKWVAYSARAERQAAFAKIVPYGGPNKKMYELVDAETLANLAYLTGSDRDALDIDTTFWLNHNDELTKRFVEWAAR